MCISSLKIYVLKIFFLFSIAVLNTFTRIYKQEKENKTKSKSAEINIIVAHEEDSRIPGVVYEDGVTILEAFSATGLRSIRYSKEISGIKQIVANDISIKAVESINKNIEENGVDKLVKSSQCDAT